VLEEVSQKHKEDLDGTQTILLELQLMKPAEEKNDQAVNEEKYRQEGRCQSQQRMASFPREKDMAESFPNGPKYVCMHWAILVKRRKNYMAQHTILLKCMKIIWLYTTILAKGLKIDMEVKGHSRDRLRHKRAL
jgi:hypothetical protein